MASLQENARGGGTRDALAYYESVRSSFADAARSAGTFEQNLRVAGVAIRLRFAGEGLARVLLPALSPVLCSGVDRSDVEVALWDERTTGVSVPPPFWRLRDVVARGDVHSLAGDRLCVQVDSWNKLLTLWDRERRQGLVWAADADRLPYWVPAQPLRSILHWSIAGRRRHLLHAAAVGDAHSGALLVGPAGSGKSTTALACLAQGLGYVGDDYVVAESDRSPRSLSLYGTAKLNAPSMELLPELSGQRLTPDAAKFVIDVANSHPELMRRSAAISAILLPQVTPGRPALRPVPAVEALRALAPSTIVQHPGESASGMAVMAALVRQVPAYRFELGSDIRAVAPAIRRLLETSS